MELEQWRERIDAFHERFKATVERNSVESGIQPPLSPADNDNEGPFCGGCAVNMDGSHSLWCGACKCTAYCNKECQRLGWKAGGHKAICKLLARARSLPPADPSRRYVVQLKLAGRNGLKSWAELLEHEGQSEVAGVHLQMAAALTARERVLFALEARSHILLRFQVVPSSKRLAAPDLALFTLQAIIHPSADIPTLNMPRDEPQRPYAIWIPGDNLGSFNVDLPSGFVESDGMNRFMARPVGRLLAGAGLATSTWYVGGGFSAEAKLRPDVFSTGMQRTGDMLINAFSALDPDAYSEDDEDRFHDDRTDEDGQTNEHPSGVTHGSGSRSSTFRLLLIAGMHVFGPDAGEGQDPMLTAIVAALRAAGAQVEVAMYRKGDRRSQEALAQRLTRGSAGDGSEGSFAACMVLGLGSGDGFQPRRPTYPWGDGPWRDAVVGWVRGGGVLVIHGERAVAAVARNFFSLQWTMDGDFYRRTDHQLNQANPLLGNLASHLSPHYNVKACMLSNVPPLERVYSTVPDATTHSMVPAMAGAPVDAGRTAMAAARVGSGVVVFFGDVNWEVSTLTAVTMLTRQLVGTCRRLAAASRDLASPGRRPEGGIMF